MKKTLLLFAVFFTAIFTSNAQDEDFVFDGGEDSNFYFKITNYDPFEVEVDSCKVPTANIVIPASIFFGDLGGDIPVTGLGDQLFCAESDLSKYPRAKPYVAADEANGIPEDLGNTIIETVSLPTSVVSIGANAFANANLTTINLDNIINLGGSAFAKCGELTDLGSLLNVQGVFGAYAFYQCHSLTNSELKLSEGVTEFGNGTFYAMNSLSQFSVPSTVTNVGTLLGGLNPNLIGVQFNWPDASVCTINVKHLFRSGAIDIDSDPLPTEEDFYAAYNFKIYIPVGSKDTYTSHPSLGYFPDSFFIEGDMPETTIGNTFVDAGFEFTVASDDPKEVIVKSISASTAAVTIPATATDASNNEVYSVIAVGANVFANDETLTSVALPASVVTLETGAFESCINLETINLENVVSVNTQNVFYNTPKLASVNLAVATDIGNFAFNGIEGSSTLTSVSIPSAVNIGKAAFGNSAFTSLDIPASVVTIGQKVFLNCPLTQVQVNWTTAETIPVIDVTQDVEVEGVVTAGNATFLGVDTAGVTLYVPENTTALYEAAIGWQDFNIMEGVLSVAGVDQALALNVYPNPASDVVTVTGADLDGAALSIYDITGALVATQTVSGDAATVDVSNLVSGVYILKINSGSASFVQQIVKK